MKTGSLLTFLCLLSQTLFSQDHTAEIVKDIRGKYQEINANRAAYRKVWADRMDETTEGGEVIGYFQKDTVMLIEEYLYAEGGKSCTSIYYDHGAPAFIFLQMYKYNVPFYDSAFNMSLSEITTDRSYFYKGKMIRWINPQNRVLAERDKAFVENEKGALSLAKELYNDILLADVRHKPLPAGRVKTK
ncbi:MAG: hypothetical protein J7623_23240 [Chitinophaga sp.]|uniref:hypothetical protein n=1 Tax=Chitinophaga sp. TaxID=1869181 RepID=UPI001B1D17DC|nr:hypothetical protein [Chitinophaga sp.]MBO9731575.1 hypothetical protein [Chitinophaga sp.]